jgi:hypothetical protein
VRDARPLVAAALVGLAAACASGAPPAPAGYRATPLGESPEPFRDAQSSLRRLAARRVAGDAAGVRALSRDVLAAGRRLVSMERPEDLRREDVARFLEGRARFIDALNAYDRAAAGSDDAALFAAADGLERSFWAFFDAYRGVPAEGAV